jgi:hypothetical protein
VNRPAFGNRTRFDLRLRFYPSGQARAIADLRNEKAGPSGIGRRGRDVFGDARAEPTRKILPSRAEFVSQHEIISLNLLTYFLKSPGTKLARREAAKTQKSRTRSWQCVARTDKGFWLLSAPD